MRIAGWLSGFALMAVAASASAATLTPVAGHTLLNQGAGYKPISGSVEVKPGDSILVNPGGGAQLAYGACATFEIKPGDVVTVADEASIPCAGAGAGAAAVGAGLGTSTLIIGGAAVAVGVGVVAGVSSSSNKPASP